MIKRTFCHLPGIGIGREKRLWDSGIQNWDQAIDIAKNGRRGPIRKELQELIWNSRNELKNGNLRYFADGLPAGQLWRLFPYFKESAAYLDIETTGLEYGSYITTIALYDGKSICHYVNGRNLQEFEEHIRRYKVIVTYNGKCFDVPFIENFFQLKMDQVHLDLRYLLKSLGYSGGLKGCEARLGIARGELEGIDGFFAVRLWYDYKNNHNERALETLLAYNIADVLNLEQLLAIAYNKKLEETPFRESNLLKLPEKKSNPFEADKATVHAIKQKFYGTWY